MIPPLVTADCRCPKSQLAAVPVPTTVVGFDVSAAWPRAGMAIVHRPLGALASMTVPLEAPLLDAPLLDPVPAPLPDPDAAPELELPLAPTRPPLLPPLVPLLLADPEEPPSSGAACPDELEPHPAPRAHAKAPSESGAAKVDRRMKILLNPWEARSARTGSALARRAQPAPCLPCDVRARGLVHSHIALRPIALMATTYRGGGEV